MDAFTTRLGNRNDDRPVLQRRLDSNNVVQHPTQECLNRIAQHHIEKNGHNANDELRVREIHKKFPQAGHIQQVVFANPFTSSDYKLLEVDKKLLAAIENDGEELIIRGRMSDFVVACTSSRTFQFRECESSNSIVMLPDLTLNTDGATNSCCTVASISRTYLEMVELASNFSIRLREILNAHTIDVISIEEGVDEMLEYTEPVPWSRLLSEVQMSKAQLHNAIQKYAVLKYENGDCHLLNAASQRRILDAVVELCDDINAPHIDADRIVRDALIARLPFPINLRTPIADWVLEKFCDKLEDDGYALSQSKLCRARASEVLSTDKARDFPVEFFCRLVERLLPCGFECQLDGLEGISYFDENLVTGKTIRSLEVADLPDGPRERLERLFTIKPIWRKADLQPYVLDFCAGAAGVEEYLLRNCRLVRKGDEKLFTLKPL